MSIVFPIVRLVKHEELGFEPETVSRKEFELLQYQYAACELAGYWNDDKLGFREVTWPDLDHDPHKLMAIMPSKAMADFSHACREFAEDRRIAKREDDDNSAYGYSWSPGGSQMGYGYYSPVDAWLITHRGGSVFLYRYEDETIEESFHTWMGHWIAEPIPSHWPSASAELSSLLVPDSMKRMHDMRGRVRKIRPSYGMFR